MPVTIKRGGLKFRDASSGEYIDVDVVGERKTSEQIADIEAAGAAERSAIQTKGEQTRNSIPADYTDLSDSVGDLTSAIALQDENIPDTVQTIAFDSAGNIQSITHMRGNVAVRTDTFTFADTAITEVRTLATGESLTIVTNTDTLQTTVTYAAA